MAKYAADTAVPVERSRAEIEKTLQRFGADEFVYMHSPTDASVGFRARGRLVRFRLPLRDTLKHDTQKQRDQAVRSAWRALALSIKAKCVAVDSGIVSFESEFMPQTVMPDGMTAADHVLPRIADAYAGRKSISLLPHFPTTDDAT